MSDTPVELKPAGVGRRLAALVYDSFLLFGLLVVPLLVATGVMATRTKDLPNNAVIHEIPTMAPTPVLQAYWVLVVLAFYCYFWRRNGQTLGMQAWRIRVDSAEGGRPSWRQCLIRAAIGPLSLLCAGLGFWWIWFDKKRRSWHDWVSGTIVVQLPKRKK